MSGTNCPDCGRWINFPPTQLAAPSAEDVAACCVMYGKDDCPTHAPASDVELIVRLREMAEYKYQHHTVHAPAVMRLAADRLEALFKCG